MRLKPLFVTVVLAAEPTAVAADVVNCLLTSTANELDPTMRIYAHERETHSILLEATTNYGDRLPYLFDLAEQVGFGIQKWKMERVDEEYRYFLLIEFEGDLPNRLRFTTQSMKDDFNTVEELNVISCTTE